MGVEVRYNGRVVLKGRKSVTNGLWYVPITTNKEVDPNKTLEIRKEQLQTIKETTYSARQVNLEFHTTCAAELNISKSWEP